MKIAILLSNDDFENNNAKKNDNSDINKVIKKVYIILYYTIFYFILFFFFISLNIDNQKFFWTGRRDISLIIVDLPCSIVPIVPIFINF